MAKIAFIDVTVTVSFGGVQTAVWRLSETLCDMGHEVHVLGGDGDLRPYTPNPNLHVHTFPFKPREKVLDLGSRYRRIVERRSMSKHARDTLVEIDPDWVVLTKPFDFHWPGLMPSDSKVRFAFMSGGTDFCMGDRKLAKDVDAWVACSHFNAWQIRAHYKRQPKVMYNGVDVDAFAPSEDSASVRAELGVEPSTCLFAFAGRLVGWKGIAIAIKAMAEKPMQAQDAKLLLIGDGEQQAELQALAKRLDVADRVIFYGRVDHKALPAYYSAIDVGVFPSIGDEAFGITIAEAMSCAKPVIASHIGGIPEVVGNEGSCGLLVGPEDPVALAENMALLAADKDLRERMGQAARERICNLYTWHMSARRMLDAMAVD